MNKKLKVNVVNKHTFMGGTSISTISVGRGTIFGNPYTHQPVENTKAEFQCLTREESINKYKIYFMDRLATDDNFRREVVKLSKLLIHEGEINLMCYCSPKKCHGDYVAKAIKNFAEQLMKRKLS